MVASLRARNPVLGLGPCLTKLIVLGTGLGHGGQVLGPGHGFENRVLLTSLTITLRFELREGKITGFSST